LFLTIVISFIVFVIQIFCSFIHSFSWLLILNIVNFYLLNNQIITILYLIINKISIIFVASWFKIFNNLSRNSNFIGKEWCYNDSNYMKEAKEERNQRYYKCCSPIKVIERLVTAYYIGTTRWWYITCIFTWSNITTTLKL
jgi:hypothetical protein